MTPRHLADIDAVFALADRLGSVIAVAAFPSPHDEPHSWTLANSLDDMEGSSRRFTDDLLPRLLAASDESEMTYVLLDIRLEFQHIVWHLATTPWFRDLIDEAPPLSGE